jgi:uncharacterized membrane protein
MLLDLLKLAHLIGAAVILGGGAVIAFFMLWADRTKDSATIAATARIVVTADWLFTASAVIAQPITGILLARAAGWSLGESWIVASLVLYVLVGLCWLPVVWLQLRMRDLACAAVARGEPLPALYHRYMRIWFRLGWPAFIGVLAILWLMIAKPRLF